MSTTEPTQALLNEIANPSHCTSEDVAAFVRVAAAFATKYAQQGSAEGGLVEIADLDEADADLKGSLEPYRQKAGAKLRHAADLMRIVKDLRTTTESLERADREARVKARRLGYVTGLEEEPGEVIPVLVDPVPIRTR